MVGMTHFGLGQAGIRIKPTRAISGLVTTVIVAVLLVVAPESASAADRDCAKTADSVTTGILPNTSCINGQMLPARGRISLPCLTIAVLPLMPKAACTPRYDADNVDANPLNVQLEKIAQARVIRHMSSSLGAALPHAIAPAVQWEVASGRVTVAEALAYGRSISAPATGRVDILDYLPGSGDPGVNPVEVWEVKGTWNGSSADDFSRATAQAQAYVNSYHRDFGWTAAHLGTSLIGYSSDFTMSGLYTCPNYQDSYPA